LSDWIFPPVSIDPERSTMKMQCSGLLASGPPGLSMP
jgi:hypothetical protein